MVCHMDRSAVLTLTTFRERIPLPQLGQQPAQVGLLSQNERTSLKNMLDQTLRVASNGNAVNHQLEALRKGLSDLLDQDDISEL